MRDLTNRVILVTGAIQEPGRSIVAELVQYRPRLALAGADSAELTALVAQLREQGLEAESFMVDLRHTEERPRLIEQVIARFASLDVLISAEVMEHQGRFVDSNSELLREITERNFFAPVELIRLAQPHLLRSSMTGYRPAIALVASILGRVAEPGRSEQSGSWHALVGFFDAVRAEFARFDIDLMLALPGRDTEVTAAEVGRAVVTGLLKNRREVVIGKAAWWAALGNRLWPSRLRRKLAQPS